MRLDAKNPLYRYHMGLAFQRERKKQKALVSFREALELVKGKGSEKFRHELLRRIKECR